MSFEKRTPLAPKFAVKLRTCGPKGFFQISTTDSSEPLPADHGPLYAFSCAMNAAQVLIRRYCP